MKKELFNITGMTCSACSNRIYKSVAILDGVSNVSVNLLKNDMTVSFDENTISSINIIAAVKKAGYEAVLRAKNSQAGNISKKLPDPGLLEQKEIKIRLIVSFLFTIPLFYISMGHMAEMPLPFFFLTPENMIIFAFTQFLLTIPVVFINFKYYRIGFRSLFSGTPNMDSLIAVGSGAAVIFGVYSIYRMAFALGLSDMIAVHGFAMNLYFESAAMILSLITLGKFFEIRAKGKTSDAIARLVDLAPKTATVQHGSSEKIIPLEDVHIGDILVIKTGESVPVDGIITEGRGFLDESAFSGESLPLEKRPGDSVTSATINKSGYFLMRATRVGENTTLAQIVRLVDEASSSKTPIARLADTISGIFVPVVIIIAVVAVTIWLFLGFNLEFALSIGISVLVISCPCALGLATPTAIMVGTGRGALNGILFKSAEAIETAQNIDTVVLDKTGTITEGKPVVTDIVAVKKNNENKLLTIAASLEKLSEHPLGTAIVYEAEKRNITLSKVTEFIQIPGLGLSGTIDNLRYIAGNMEILRREDIIIDDTMQEKSDCFSSEGKTILYFASEKNLLGIIAVADVVKKNSRQAVFELKAMGIDVVMLTGDNTKTAEAVRYQTGISRVLAEVLPQDKELEIRLLKKQGKKVAMIGDGVNDAPALARADVGIAIGAGSDIAIESADIVLIRSDLLDAVFAIQLSKAVMRVIRQNLFWAFFYNSVGIPVAAGVFYSICGLTLNPMIAAAAMSLSSISVVLNALRLKKFYPEQIQIVEKNETRSVVKSVSNINESSTIKRENIMNKSILIEGMSCGHCTGSVEKKLAAIPGVTNVTVSLASKTADVEISGDVSDEILKTAVTDLGFKVIGIR